MRMHIYLLCIEKVMCGENKYFKLLVIYIIYVIFGLNNLYFLQSDINDVFKIQIFDKNI